MDEEDKNKTIALGDSAGTESEQSSFTINNISENPEQNKNSHVFETISMADLCAQTFPPREPVIKDLLYAGTYVFAGAPKTGKSNFMLFLSWHVATGTEMWGLPVNKGSVLYLALEDDYRRIQNRLFSMPDIVYTEDLFFTIQAPKLEEDLMSFIWEFYNNHPDTRLIIIDTLQCVRMCCNERNSYGKDYDTIRRFKKFTDTTGVCLLVVTHTRKQEAEDHFEMITGTTGISGAADGAFILRKKERIANEALLELTGRDQPDQKLTLSRELGTLSWSLIKSEVNDYVVPKDPILEKIAAFTHQHFIWQGTPSELTDLAGIEIPANMMTKRLNIMANVLEDEYEVKYSNTRNHDGRIICLESISLGDDCDGGVDCDDS